MSGSVRRSVVSCCQRAWRGRGRSNSGQQPEQMICSEEQLVSRRQLWRVELEGSQARFLEPAVEETDQQRRKSTITTTADNK